MSSLIQLLSLSITIILQAYAIHYYRQRIKNSSQSMRAVKNWFSLFSSLMTIFLMLFGFRIIAKVFVELGLRESHGHSSMPEIGASLFIVLIGIISITVGRAVIGWKMSNKK